MKRFIRIMAEEIYKSSDGEGYSSIEEVERELTNEMKSDSEEAKGITITLSRWHKEITGKDLDTNLD